MNRRHFLQLATLVACGSLSGCVTKTARRTAKTDTNKLLLRTKMEAGHGGVSGRYKRYRETAFTYAFLIDLAKANLIFERGIKP